MESVNAVSTVQEKLTGWLEALVAHLPNLVAAVVVVLLFWILAKVARSVVQRAMGRLSDNRAVTGLLATVAYLGLLALGVFIALGVLDLDKTVTSLLAGAGIIGLALAFAFQDAAENLVSGVTLSITRPFRVGDLIETNDYYARVEDISLRSTTLRTLQGHRVIVPNSAIFSNPIVNFTGERRVDVEVGVSYADDLDLAERTAIAALEGVEGRVESRAPDVVFTGFGGSSVDLAARVWIDQGKVAYPAAKSQAIVRIKKAFDDAGLTIPFPITTLDFGDLQVPPFSLDPSSPSGGEGRPAPEPGTNEG